MQFTVFTISMEVNVKASNVTDTTIQFLLLGLQHKHIFCNSKSNIVILKVLVTPLK